MSSSVYLRGILMAACLQMAACGGELGEAVGQQVLDRDEKPVAGIDLDPPKGDDDRPQFCTHEYRPVCGINPVQCVTAPCPEGIYTTFGNQCTANVQGAAVAFAGECGELEGKPYPEAVSCDTVWEPVCAATKARTPCAEAPCPAVVHKTFSNTCEADAAQAHTLFEGECGALEDARVARLDGFCPAVVEPVCALAAKNIACITEPCPSHEYQTFNNACEAELALASVVLESNCGDLEHELTMGEPPVVVSERLPAETKPVTIVGAKIKDDLLSVELAYSGCDQQHFQLVVSNAFRESFPVQAGFVFKPMVNDLCKAHWVTQFVYDLRPLKHAYQQAYQTKSGEIVLPQLGTYSF